jgi:hypothetical protein
MSRNRLLYPKINAVYDQLHRDILNLIEIGRSIHPGKLNSHLGIFGNSNKALCNILTKEVFFFYFDCACKHKAAVVVVGPL